MAEENIPIIICDKKHNPIAEIISLYGTFDRAGHVQDQSLWREEIKCLVWEEIARQKIRTQMQVLTLCGKDIPPKMEELERTLLLDDSACNEGQAARLYFHALFGMTFSRERESDTNACLNYGYSILLSHINRVIRSHGYITELGIHHCSRTNPFNLSCDLMEPFRPVVDVAVFRHNGALTSAFRLELIHLLQTPIYYGNRCFRLSDATEQYCLDAIAVLNGKKQKMGVLRLA